MANNRLDEMDTNAAGVKWLETQRKVAVRDPRGGYWWKSHDMVRAYVAGYRAAPRRRPMAPRWVLFWSIAVGLVFYLVANGWMHGWDQMWRVVR